MKIRQLFEAIESKLEVVKLPYKTGDLAPVLSKDNVEYHYNVLTKGYVNRYNAKEGDPKFNYGGAKLHNLFWVQLKKPAGANQPTGAIKELIEENHKTYVPKTSVITMMGDHFKQNKKPNRPSGNMFTGFNSPSRISN